jgi:hypothetical protein
MITIPKTLPPPILYKYYPPERAELFENWEIRFSAPSEFNDAFDSHHLLPLSSDFKTKGGRLRLLRELGVFCLTEQPDNHVMWVNYAKNHTGFVVGLDAEAPFFSDDARELRKVIYQNRPPIFDSADENGAFYKSPEWVNEKEWRCIRRFNSSESRLVSIEWPMIKEVVFGHRTPSWVISRIVAASSNYGPGFGIEPTFFFSNPIHSEWKFINKQMDVQTCEHCSGVGYKKSKAATIK